MGLRLTWGRIYSHTRPPSVGSRSTVWNTFSGSYFRFDLKGQLRVKRDVPGQAKLVLDGIVAMELEADVPPIIAANPGIDQVRLQESSAVCSL
jgi:hypothetical protein